MEYYINSNQISPFVRYAGFRSHSSVRPTSPIYAADCRMFYFTHGSATINYANQSVRTKPGDLFILPPATRYEISDADLYIVNFDFLSTDFQIEKAIPIQKDANVVPHQIVHLSDFPQFDKGLYTNILSLDSES